MNHTETYEGNKQILLLSTLGFFVSVMVWFNMAPFNSTIMEQLGLTKDEIGVLMVVNLALAIPGRIFMGRLVDQYGPRKVFSVLLIVMSIPCFVFAIGTTYWQLLISRLILGTIGASFVVGIRMISEWFPQKHTGFAQGIYAGWGNFGSALAAFTLPTVALAFGGENGWRYAIALTGLIALVYGFIYYKKAQDTPSWKKFERSKSSNGMEATSFSDLILLMLTSLPIYGGLGVLVWSLQNTAVLNVNIAIVIYGILATLYIRNMMKLWKRNREYLKTNIPKSEIYSMKQVSILSFAYFSTFGAELAVISMLPMFFQDTFTLSAVGAGVIASSFAFTNLVARPAGGWLSDKFGRRKTLMTLLFLLSILYFAMSTLSGSWPIALAVVLTMGCSMIGQAASGSVFSMVSFIKRSRTGQIAGMVGAYGNIGSVCFLATLNLFYPSVFFVVIGLCALVCFISSFFIIEPKMDGDTQVSTKKLARKAKLQYPTGLNQKV
ncbi:NarK family nitrate/nitrite MFS transporter [Aquibacillus rhizosphaerae]|uniref:Nitrate/nitrite transporter n=1 Tax=Aquibacillus rhizosphaerae TaxID=3051431 RepID=A0ABT7LA60_9BACI|nr:NarK family nitrate/nitrite MFS transporter [Aquibacillus sp. LR5S19]MDL4842284.1 NarK family nitrate/nitrite MFS transporter [Aquibacillus sp. LR5S19]